MGLFVPADVAAIMAESAYAYHDPQGGAVNDLNADTLRSEADELDGFFTPALDQVGGVLVPGSGGGGPGTGGQGLNPGTYAPSEPPWVYPPPGSQSFMIPGVIPTPAADGLDHVIFQATVPDGYYGVINGLSHNYTGPGFVQGSGDLTFRILRNNQAVRNYSNILVEFGTPQQRLPIDGIYLISGETFKYVVSVSTTAIIPVAGTFIIAFFKGYFYPQQFGGAS